MYTPISRSLDFVNKFPTELKDKTQLQRFLECHNYIYYSGTWSIVQLNYSTIKKEILAIILCISKFQDDLFSKSFVLKIDCKTTNSVLKKDVKNLVSKHIFARWQSLLSCFDFEIEHIEGIKNSLSNFLTRYFL